MAPVILPTVTQGAPETQLETGEGSGDGTGDTDWVGDGVGLGSSFLVNAKAG